MDGHTGSLIRTCRMEWSPTESNASQWHWLCSCGASDGVDDPYLMSIDARENFEDHVQEESDKKKAEEEKEEAANHRLIEISVTRAPIGWLYKWVCSCGLKGVPSCDRYDANIEHNRHRLRQGLFRPAVPNTAGVYVVHPDIVKAGIRADSSSHLVCPSALFPTTHAISTVHVLPMCVHCSRSDRVIRQYAGWEE